MARRVAPLSDAECRQAKVKEKIYKLFDGGGLYLEITPSGSKWWRIKYTFNGRDNRLSLGVYPGVTLAEAREKRDTLKKKIDDGIDPSQERKEEKHRKSVATDNCFKSVTVAWWNAWKDDKVPANALSVLRRLENNVFPHIGDIPVTELTARHFMLTVKKVEARGVGELAKRVLNTCGQNHALRCSAWFSRA